MDVREKLVDLLGNIYLPIMAGPDVIGEYRIPHKLKEEIADHLIANGITVQEQDGCEYCRAASYTENPFIVITQMGREVKTQFNFCPNCGRSLQQPPKRE